MKTGRIKTAWVFFTLFFYTAMVSLRAVFHYLFRKPNRSWIDKTLHHWSDQLLRAVKVSYTVINPLNVQPEAGKATILMCNHTSVFDIPLGFKIYPQHSIRMLSKKELSKIPLFGKGMSVAEFPFVDRKNRVKAIEDLEYAKQLMESGIVLWIAPEGTRTIDGKLARFKKGAFLTAIQAKATIIPVGFRGVFELLPTRSFQVNLNQKVEIHIGKPIDASQFTAENNDLLIQETYEVIKQLVGD